MLYRYCAAIDRIQPDALIANVFHADATIDRSGAPFPVAEFVAAVAARHPGVPNASHMVSNMLIDFLDRDSAFVESWCLALERHPPSGPESRTIDRIYRVRYGDRFERTQPVADRQQDAEVAAGVNSIDNMSISP